ncbi:MAG: diacylglycerol kinase family lipid kinase [Muribaculaceae bacterium]|nr:diacylglycerol kinase family lipid kinase [Muribaculaceae bacterium]
MKHAPLKTLLIINPISGTNSKHGLRAIIEKRVKTMGHLIDTELTQGPGDATLIAQRAVRNGYDVVLACGGDGTVNEVAAGLVSSNVALAILPNGSGNGLARHIDIPVDPILALDMLKKGSIVNCDYCTANDIPFFCTFGLGFDAAVSHRFAAGHKRGLIAYLKSAVDEFVRFTPDKYELTIGEKTLSVDAFLIACCNASQYGNNAYIAPTASITDGQLDITIVHSGNAISEALVGVELLAGSITNRGLIDTFRADSIRITRPSSGIAHIDGEPIELPEVINIVCHPGGLKIIAPKKQMKFIPLLTPAYRFARECTMRIGQIFSRH